MAGVYIHVPFCRRRCSYCDFYFVTSHRSVPQYVEAICKEIALRAQAIASPQKIETIYFGGGTPSRLSTDDLGRILNAVSNHFGTTYVKEVTIEVNPEDPDTAYLDRLRDLGVTRLSIGLQSMRDEDLRFMHRSHTAEQARAFVERALGAGFSSISVDLIFALPDMTSQHWRDNLDFAVASGAQHVSLYGLTVEPRTLLGKWVRTGSVTPAPEFEVERQFRTAHEVMSAHGFDHYEVSNFAMPGHRSLHNRSYWNHITYFGFGPSAHSLWKSEKAVRWENARNLPRYLQSLSEGILPVSSEEQLDEDMLMREYVLLGLRTDVGIDLGRLRDQYAHRVSENGSILIQAMQEAGKLCVSGDQIRLTLDGLLVADGVTAMLLRSNAIEPI